MISANQLRAARALLNIDQRQTAELADLSVPTIQRMEASDGVIRGNVDSLMKLVSALENAGNRVDQSGCSELGWRSRRPVKGTRHEAKDEEYKATQAFLVANAGTRSMMNTGVVGTMDFPIEDDENAEDSCSCKRILAP